MPVLYSVLPITKSKITTLGIEGRYACMVNSEWMLMGGPIVGAFYLLRHHMHIGTHINWPYQQP